jgi:thiamine biosynthesis lipoprotein
MSRPRSTRREFLQGKAAADALVQAACGDTLPGEMPEPAAGGYLLQWSRRAMACKFEFFLNAGQYPRAAEAAVAAFDLVDHLEDQLSVYREHSEISQLNRSAAGGSVAVEPRVFALLEQAVRIFHETEGAYDITAAPLSNVWGFTRRAGSIPTPDTLAAALERVGSEHLELDSGSSSVRFRKVGIEINLGSIGKGFALDRCAELFLAEGVHDFLLHGGHSSVLARGANASLGPEQGWSVGVRNPLHPDRRLGQLSLRGRALATSGSGTQFFMHHDRRYGHILDPKSGWPADGVLSATVLAPTAAEADALSTAFYVMGPQRAREYCAGHPQFAALLVCPGVREGGLEQHLIGLDEHEWSPVDESD